MSSVQGGQVRGDECWRRADPVPADPIPNVLRLFTWSERHVAPSKRAGGGVVAGCTEMVVSASYLPHGNLLERAVAT